MFGPMELGIILAIALVIFGGKKLRSLGGDLGGAISEFKSSMNEDEEEEKKVETEAASTATSDNPATGSDNSEATNG